jgi:hypothetical protein
VAILGGALAALWAVDGFRLRQRAIAAGPFAERCSGRRRPFVLGPAGVVLDETTRQAASEHAQNMGLDVLDLVSPRIASWRAMVLLLVIDPLRFRHDRFTRGFSAGDAILVRSSVLERLGTSPHPTDDAAKSHPSGCSAAAPAGTPSRWSSLRAS